ncbi:SRPBCC domain-containing protein [Actinophytocola xinjiangensis]|nr:SRPBCC domain-containing protein [Actinophytocola xinjiangensis]
MRIEPHGERDIVMTREFAAPRRLVFDAHTRPDLLARWYGPHGWRLEHCEVDLRVGGGWHYRLRGPEGVAMTLRGTYLDLAAPERIVTTESNVDCEARAAHEAVVTTVLVEHERRTLPTTLLTTTARFPTRAVRDAVLSSGMERGVVQGFERLDAVLAAGRVAGRITAT